MRPVTSNMASTVWPMGCRKLLLIMVGRGVILLCAPEIDAAIAGPEAGQDLVAVGFGEDGEFIGRLLRSQHLDDGADLSLALRHGADIQRDQIHGDPADDIDLPLADEGDGAVAHAAQETIGIADPHGCNPAGRAYGMCCPIADAHTSFDPTG